MTGEYTSRQAADLAAIDHGHFWFASRNALILWALGRYFPEARSVLEVGCGTGHVLRALAAARPELDLTGTELSTDCLRLAAEAVPTATLVHADARTPMERGTFDVAGAFDVIEHVGDDVDVLRAMAHAVRPGGGVLVTVPQHAWLWSPLDEQSGHQRRYARRALLDVVRRAGLDVMRVTSFVSLLLPALLLSRLVQRGVAVTPGSEFAATAGVNGIGLAVMRAERALIRAGVSLPAGGSLLVVARRA